MDYTTVFDRDRGYRGIPPRRKFNAKSIAESISEDYDRMVMNQGLVQRDYLDEAKRAMADHMDDMLIRSMITGVKPARGGSALETMMEYCAEDREPSYWDRPAMMRAGHQGGITAKIGSDYSVVV